MMKRKNKVLLQYSGGKDSTACLVKLQEDGYQLEAIHFTHLYCYELPTMEAKRICNERNVKLNVIDLTAEIENLFLDNFSQRPCRFCKGIMDSVTVEFAVKNGFHLVCVGDTASDKTLVDRVKATGEQEIMISRYFNKAVELPDGLKIIRPLIYYSNEDVFRYLDEHGISLKRNNDTGDKYFEYSREGCPLQFKDYGVAYTRQLMSDLKKVNSMCSKFATQKGIKASIHLPSEFIVTIPRGYEAECKSYLEKNGYTFTKKREMEDVINTYWFSVFIYSEICNIKCIEELLLRFYERLGISKVLSSSFENTICIKSFAMDTVATLCKENYRVYGHIRSVKDIGEEFLKSLFIELFHTFNFSIQKIEEKHEINISPLLKITPNCRYIAGEKLGKSVIRSSNIDNISACDMVRLKELNVGYIIDLRNEKNNKSDFYELFEENGIKYLRIPFVGDNPPKSEKTYETVNVVKSYLKLINQHDVLKSIFEVILQADETVLILCKYGRDRSGVVSLLLELLSNLSFEEIINDYVISNFYLDDNRILDSLHPLEAEWIIEFVEAFNKKYGSIENYLHIIGLDDNQIVQLRRKMEVS